MKTIPLTQGKVALVDDADYPALSIHKWHAFQSHKLWYAGRRKTRTGPIVLMHRQILGLLAGDKRQTDHRDWDGLNNQRSNLRLATAVTNGQNSRRQRGASGFRGVRYESRFVLAKPWQAQIRLGNGRRVTLGLFATAEQAALTYDAAAHRYHGEFAVLNFPRRNEPKR